MFEDAGVKSVDYDNRIYRMAGLDPSALRASPAMLQMLQAGFDATNGTFKNLTMTTANTAQQAYISACDLAMLQVQSGAMSYQDAIRAAINKAAADGTYVLYSSGRSDRIEVAIRRAVLTGVSHTCRTIGEYNATSVGSDLMELSAHAGARPSHAAWQGKIVSLSGKRGYLSKTDIGYGTADGFGGINCRHDWYPFFPGISQHNYTDKDIKRLDDMTVTYNGQTMPYYDATQLQRKMEREIRELKRKMVATEAARDAATNKKLIVDPDTDFNVHAKHMSEKRAELKGFLSQTAFLGDGSRSQLYGYGRSMSGKAVQTAKKIKEYDSLIGTMTSIGVPVTGVSDHFGARAIARNISVSDVHDALTNPLGTGKIKTDKKGRRSLALIGAKAKVQVNPDTGNLATVWETSEKLKKKYGVIP